jgi:homoserine dehydrogenase
MEIRTALVGTGTIGSGVVQVLKNNSKIIKKRTMVDIALKKVCELDFDKAKKLGIDEKILTKDYKEIIADKETDVIIELIGGYEPARTIILEALNAKKHVVTANKAVIAKHGKEIFEAASKNNVRICFEAAVGGCIPIIKSIRESYASERINTIYGIPAILGEGVVNRFSDTSHAKLAVNLSRMKNTSPLILSKMVFLSIYSL